jgi:origin recognition complex subunit 6
MHRRPPLPPRVYAKLLEMMENGLQLQKPAKTRAAEGKEIARSGSSPVKGTSTPRKRVGGAGAESTPVTTPSKKVAFAGKVSAQKVRGPGKDDEAPDWVMPLIRRLCTRFTTPLLPPHVYTGTCVVLKLAKLWPVVGSEREDDIRTSITAMTIAIYFMVLTKMQRGKMTPELYVDRCGKALDVAVEMGSVSFSKDVVDGWIKKMNDKGWCRQQDWWDSVPEDVMDVEAQDNGCEDVAEEDDVVCSRRKRRRLLVEGDQTEGDKEGVLLSGLGTMMQDAVDFLSEERTLNYLEWKEGVLGRIKQMEKGKGRTVSVR